MRLSECLNYADIKTLRSIAENYEFDCTLHSKLSLHQEIMYNFRIPSFLSEHLPVWANDRRTGLLRLSLESNRFYTVEELQAWLSEEGIEQAIRQGWLFPTSRQPDSRKLYCVPEELRGQIATFMIKDFSSQLQTNEEGPLLYADEENLMAQDLDVVLEYVRNHEVTLTQDGTMYKRHLVRLLEMMQIEEEPVTGGWRFGYGRRFHEYPNRFALLYDFAFAEGFIEESELGLLQVGPQIDKWLQAEEAERTSWLLKHYIASYRRVILRLPIILRLMGITEHHWIEESSMFKATQPFINDYYYDSVDDVWNLRILRMIQHLGIIRRGVDESGTRWFQTTNIGQQLLATGEMPEVVSNSVKQKILIVQPNFNILATADQPTVTAQLAEITTLRETGAIRVYRLSQESFCRGLGGERTCQQWMEFLQAHSQSAIPGNVEKTLLDWEKWWAAEQDPMTS